MATVRSVSQSYHSPVSFESIIRYGLITIVCHWLWYVTELLSLFVFFDSSIITVSGTRSKFSYYRMGYVSWGISVLYLQYTIPCFLVRLIRCSFWIVTTVLRLCGRWSNSTDTVDENGISEPFVTSLVEIYKLRDLLPCSVPLLLLRLPTAWCSAAMETCRLLGHRVGPCTLVCGAYPGSAR